MSLKGSDTMRVDKALARKKDRLRKFLASKAYRDFHATYLDFVQHVIVPLIGLYYV